MMTSKWIYSCPFDHRFWAAFFPISYRSSSDSFTALAFPLAFPPLLLSAYLPVNSGSGSVLPVACCTTAKATCVKYLRGFYLVFMLGKIAKEQVYFYAAKFQTEPLPATHDPRQLYGRGDSSDLREVAPRNWEDVHTTIF